MNDAGRLAFVIVLFFLAMVCFFFTFHPGGVEGVSNPGQMLQWLFGVFGEATGANNTNTDAQLLSSTSGGASALAYPGYTSSPDATNGAAPTNVSAV